MAGTGREIQVHMVRRIPLRELPFLVSFGIYMFFGILTQTMYYQYFSGSRYRLILGGCVLILAFQELIFSRDWLRLPVREIGGGLLCLLAAAYTWKIADGNMLQQSVAFLFLYLFCARNVDHLHIAEVSRIVSWIVLVLVVVSAKLGVISGDQRKDPPVPGLPIYPAAARHPVQYPHADHPDPQGIHMDQ